ncbi:hypothetical protein Dimus_013231 [Dionaea muscipula]
MVFEEFGVSLVDKKGEEPNRYDYFKETFLTMCKLIRENGVWWIGTGENRRRDDAREEEGPAEDVHEEEEEVDVEEPVTETPAAPSFPPSPGDSTTQQKEQTPAGVDPSGPSGHLPESVMNRLQAEFERARANRIEVDLEKAQAENARLLALLQQA